MIIHLGNNRLASILPKEEFPLPVKFMEVKVHFIPDSSEVVQVHFPSSNVLFLYGEKFFSCLEDDFLFRLMLPEKHRNAE